MVPPSSNAFMMNYSAYSYVDTLIRALIVSLVVTKVAALLPDSKMQNLVAFHSIPDTIAMVVDNIDLRNLNYILLVPSNIIHSVWI
ncbi:hypothetical protein DERP_001382 [Dermatophagoides pteronyssinus]|uniref:Uncharacterized protein n=1 Tax=Dermatophagoides pteronyssinus TaxID=6956 RepID=A0ABQ8JEG0_DERPT|nr:hypothetical protein DERP_001382 [Dermatophagoides pteronyssinus]